MGLSAFSNATGPVRVGAWARVAPLVAAVLLCALPARADPPASPMAVGAVARKVHGAAGTFDLTLSANPAEPTTEPRQGPQHTIVFTFDKPIAGGTAAVAAGVATAGTPTYSGHEMSVPLDGVANGQYVTVVARDVTAADGGTRGTGGVTVGFLSGDVSRNRSVSLTDVLMVNGMLSQPVTGSSFLHDVDASGSISILDKMLVNARLAKVLPAAPTNRPPHAGAGVAQDAATGTVVTLDGSASADPNGDPLTYSWVLKSRPPNSTAVLAGDATAHPTFVPDLPGAYVAGLVVGDGVFDSVEATVRVNVTTPLSAGEARKDAARFLRQATFGASREEIDQLVTQGYSAWLSDQFAMPLTSHLATVTADPNLVDRPWEVTSPSLWKQYFEGADQLRQRVGFALSQIFVVSLKNDVVAIAHCGAANYVDILNRNAFGNARDLFREVTLNPIMGHYLSMSGSAKADPVLKTQPDENYAREVMHLFSIGSVMLNVDGTVRLDDKGQPIPTYTEDTVRDFARALSGWTFAGQDETQPWRWLYPDIYGDDPTLWAQRGCASFTTPMEPWTGDYTSVDEQRVIPGPPHDTDAKSLLDYPGAPHRTLPAGQSPRDDLERLIDNVFNHPNVGPFLGRQLIQRLVTSNPSPQYVERVAMAFNDNGNGVRGDMKAVVRAILLDDEARSLAVAGQPSFGKLTEPVVRFVQLHRAFRAKRANGYYDLWDFSQPTLLAQDPLRAPTVFNFYRPEFAPAGPVTQANLVAPEFEITNPSSVAGFSDFSKWGIIHGFDAYNADPGKRMVPDFSHYLSLAGTPAQLVDELDVVLCGGGMNSAFKAQIVESLANIAVPSDPAAEREERLSVALWLIVNSPDYSVQK